MINNGVEWTNLVNNDVLPSKLLQMCFFSKNHLVTRNADIKLLINETLVYQSVALILGSLQNQNIDFWSPLGKFSLPIIERRLRDSNQMRACDSHNMS